MAKRKLLITLGDSYTEGVGCYDFSLNPEQLEYSNISMDFYNQQRSIFHEKGWPNRVGKKLGYDKVINLGYGGSSNSTHLKLFIDKILPLFPKLKEEYDILVIWMMTASSRFSFYSDTGIKDFMPSIFGHSPVKDNSLHLEKGYLVDMPEVIIGPLREQIHLIKLSYLIFENLGINFLYTSWNLYFKEVYNFLSPERFITPYPSFICPSPNSNDKSEVCDHPNENGYEIMAEEIVENIKRFHPQLFSKSNATQIEWEYLGDVNYSLSYLDLYPFSKQ